MSPKVPSYLTAERVRYQSFITVVFEGCTILALGKQLKRTKHFLI